MRMVDLAVPLLTGDPTTKAMDIFRAATARPVHFTTVARWKKRNWQVEARLEHPLAAAMRMVDLAVPLLTGDPTTKARDIVGEGKGGDLGGSRIIKKKKSTWQLVASPEPKISAAKQLAIRLFAPPTSVLPTK